jgi:hypothetical protein
MGRMSPLSPPSPHPGQGTSSLGVPHYVFVAEEGDNPPSLEDPVAYIEWAQARMNRKKAAVRAARFESDAVLLECIVG